MNVGNILTSIVPWVRRDERRKGEGSSSGLQSSNAPDDVDARSPLLTADLPSQQSFGSVAQPQSYGAAEPSPNPPGLRESPERYRRDSALDRVPEEAAGIPESGVNDEGDEEEWDLEAQGLYTGVYGHRDIFSQTGFSYSVPFAGSYRKAVVWFSLVPLTSALAFLVLAILPHLAWPSERHSPSNNTKYFLFPLPETLVAAALWSLSHLIRDPIFTVVSKFIPYELANAIVFNAVHVTLTQLLRLSALAVLRIRHQMDFPLPTSDDPAFQRVWWIALGWSLAEVTAGIAQGYGYLALYRNVMLPPERVQDLMAKSKTITSQDGFISLSPSTIRPDDSANGNSEPTVVEGNGGRNSVEEDVEEVVESEVDEDVEQLIEIKDREELEEIYGIPFIVCAACVS